VTFERRSLSKAAEVNWEKSQTTFSNLHATSDGTIETDGAGMLQVLVPPLDIFILYWYFGFLIVSK